MNKQSVANSAWIPGLSRVFCCAILLLFAAPADAATWTLEKARKQILAHTHFAELKDAAVQKEQARGRAALPWKNPFFSYQREHTFAPGSGGAAFSGTSENFFSLGQTFDISFRRGLFEEAGRRRGKAASITWEARRRDVVVNIEEMFFNTLASDLRKKASETWLFRLEELVKIARVREKAGDASRYEVLRIEREIAEAEGRRDQAEVQRMQYWSEMASWLEDAPARMHLEGHLSPPPPPEQRKELPRPLHSLALDEKAAALSLEQDAAARWFLPPITASLGAKTVLGHQGLLPQTGELGYLLYVQVPLPVLNRSEAKISELNAARRMALAEAEMEAHHVVKRAAAAHAVWAKALAAGDAHNVRSKGQSAVLVKTAKAAWLGGELSLLALLEAERTLIEDQLVSIDLRLRARHAQISFAALTLETSR